MFLPECSRILFIHNMFSIYYLHYFYILHDILSVWHYYYIVTAIVADDFSIYCLFY
ncbi:hypothetical protein C1646_713618 [Rhizophagus diaphanus]|nr:hypothetical protein C1646_713618 [Rhizophagus diaphanus] [Rhizophagus sp. MUCL 43196]